MTLVDAFLLLAQAETQQPNMLMQFLPLILIFVAFYFLLIAPQRKKQKEHEKMISELKPGEEVVTSGGIIGTITHVKADRFIIKVDDQTRLEVKKGFITAKSTGEPAK